MSQPINIPAFRHGKDDGLSHTAKRLRREAQEKTRDAEIMAKHAQDLKEEAQKLLEAADILDGGSAYIATPNGKNGILVETAAKHNRKAELWDLIKEKGPLRRKDIAKYLPEMPKGTLSYLLNEKQGFIRKDDKLWHIAQ